MGESGAEVAVVSADELLVGELARAAAAAGVEVRVEREPRAALARWRESAAVVVGSDAAGELVAADPPRRERVLLAVRQSAPRDYEWALALGAERLFTSPVEEAWLVEYLADLADGAGPPALAVGILGGAGGVGATVFATALAGVAARHAEVALVDLDPLGAGIDEIAGMDARAGMRWDTLAATAGRLSARAVREALPRWHQARVLAWSREPAPPLDPVVARAAFAAISRASNLVVLDLPRYPDPVCAELLPHCDRVLVVTTAAVPAVLSTSRAVQRVDGARIEVVVRASRHTVAPEEVAAFLDLPLAAGMPGQRGLEEDISAGAGPLGPRRGPLAVAAAQVWSRLGAEQR